MSARSPCLGTACREEGEASVPAVTGPAGLWPKSLSAVGRHGRLRTFLGRGLGTGEAPLGSRGTGSGVRGTALQGPVPGAKSRWRPVCSCRIGELCKPGPTTHYLSPRPQGHGWAAQWAGSARQ